MKSSIYLLLLILLITGCSQHISYGKKELQDDDLIKKLDINSTTLDDVLEILKEPQEIFFLRDGVELWRYEFVYHTNTKYPLLTNLKNQNNLYLLFDSSGLLIKKRKTLYVEPLDSRDKNNDDSNCNLFHKNQFHKNHSDDHMDIHKQHHEDAMKIHKEQTELNK